MKKPSEKKTGRGNTIFGPWQNFEKPLGPIIFYPIFKKNHSVLKIGKME